MEEFGGRPKLKAHPSEVVDGLAIHLHPDAEEMAE